MYYIICVRSKNDSELNHTILAASKLPQVVAATLEVTSKGATKAVHDDLPNQDISPYACRVDTAGIRATNRLPPPETHTLGLSKFETVGCLQVVSCTEKLDVGISYLK